MLRRVLAVNTVIDEHRRVSFVNFGEVVDSHLEAVEFIRRYAQVAVPRRFKTVVTSAAGYPLDTTYYQTVKGMVGPVDILEPGGNLVVVSECSEGIGSAEYREAQRRLIERGPEGFFADISRKSHADVDEWQTQMQLKPMRVGAVHLFSPGLRARGARADRRERRRFPGGYPAALRGRRRRQPCRSRAGRAVRGAGVPACWVILRDR